MVANGNHGKILQDEVFATSRYRSGPMQRVGGRGVTIYEGGGVAIAIRGAKRDVDSTAVIVIGR